MAGFPNNPSIGTPHTIGSKTWYWDGSAWTLSMDPPSGGGGGGDVEILDDLLDVDTGGPPVSSEKAYNYYIQEDPVKENAWGRYSVDPQFRTIRFHRYDIDGNDLEELFNFTTPREGYEGTKHSATAADGSFELNSGVTAKATNDDSLYYEFTYQSQDFINAVYNEGVSKLFTLYATDFGALTDGAILVYNQSDELWKPEAQGGGGGGGISIGRGAAVYIQSDPPDYSNLKQGDLWIHDLNYYMYVRQGGGWIALTGPEGGSGGGGNFANDSKITLNNRRGLFFNTDQGQAGGIQFTLNQPTDSLFSISAKNIVTVGMVPHVDPVDNDLWIFEEDYTLYVRKHNEWIALTGKDAGTGASSNRLEQPCVLNGGKPFSIFCNEGATDLSGMSNVHISVLPPDNPKKGALWYDSEHLELRVFYVTGNSAPVWVSATHPAMRPNYTEPENARPITITGPTQAIGDTRTGPYRAILSKEVRESAKREKVEWNVVDNTINVTIDRDKEDDTMAHYKYHGFGVTYLTASVTYEDEGGNTVTAMAENYRVSITSIPPGSPIAYNVRVVEDPNDATGVVYEIDGVIQSHLNLQRNRRYIFNQSHNSNCGYPLYFYLALNRDPDGTLNDTIDVNDKYGEATDGPGGLCVTRYGDIVEILTPHDAPARLAYGSDTDPDMGFWIYPFDIDGIVFDPENPNSYPYP